MRRITQMLVAGGLAMSLLLTGCGQGGDATTSSDNTQESAAETTDAGEEGTAASEELAELNGWWKVTTLLIAPDVEPFDEEMMDVYAELYHSPCVLKINAADQTFEMSAFGVALVGTIEAAPEDGWLAMNAESGAGFYDALESLKCRLEEDGSLTVAVEVGAAESEEPLSMSYTCVPDNDLKDKAVTDSVFQYTFDAYMDFRNSNGDLPINWYDEPKVLAEGGGCQLLLWGVGETDTDYILMFGIANENQFPLMVANYFMGTELTANGNTPISPAFGCYMFGYTEEEDGGLRVYDCPISVPKADVNNSLTSLSGTFDISTVSLASFTTLDFSVDL